jgi:hypothetical protein
VLTDNEILAIAEAHVRTWYGGDWRPSASVVLSDPDGVFFRCERIDGVEYTGMPTPFFVFRDTARLINLGYVPYLTAAEMSVLEKDRATFQALLDPTHPGHAAAMAPYIRRAIAQGPAPLFKWLDE